MVDCITIAESLLLILAARRWYQIYQGDQALSQHACMHGNPS